MAEAERLRKAEEAERIRREEIEKKRKEMILEKQRLQDQLDTKRHKRDQLQQEKDAQEAKQADTKKRLDEISMRLQVMDYIFINRLYFHIWLKCSWKMYFIRNWLNLMSSLRFNILFQYVFINFTPLHLSLKF